jgi:predicted GNAT family N-acyltransferase
MTLDVGPTNDLPTCLALRREVFIEEQGVPQALEQDGRDGQAHHILARLGGAPVGCARILIKGNTGKIGRVCVLKSRRGQGLGLALVEACLAQLRTVEGINRAELGAQTQAMGLYARLGFTAYGEEFLDADMPHRMMERAL